MSRMSTHQPVPEKEQRGARMKRTEELKISFSDQPRIYLELWRLLQLLGMPLNFLR